MSMHEIEALTEASIRLSDRSDDIDHRSLFKSLYDFEAVFDTGFTRFRLMDILLKRRFAYRLTLEDHPDYARFKETLEAIRKKDFEHIERDPSAEWHRETNPSVAYWSKGDLYCEAGSEIWAKLCQQGRFSGADREPPKAIDASDMAALVVSLALARQPEDKKIVAWWYAALPVAIFWGASSRKVVSAPNDQVLQTIRAAVVTSKAYEIKTDWGLLAYPERDGEGMSELGADEKRFLEWWYEPVWNAASKAI